jgi:prophage regulatory protein
MPHPSRSAAETLPAVAYGVAKCDTAVSGLPLSELPLEAYLRLPHVMAVSGLSRTTIWDQVRLGRFPAPVKLTSHATGWRWGSLKAWLENPAGWRADRPAV